MTGVGNRDRRICIMGLEVGRDKSVYVGCWIWKDKNGYMSNDSSM